MVEGRGIEKERSRKVEKAAERREVHKDLTDLTDAQQWTESILNMQNTPLMSSLPSPRCYWASDPDKHAEKSIALQHSPSPTEEHNGNLICKIIKSCLKELQSVNTVF